MRKRSIGQELSNEKKSDGVRVDHQKEKGGESSPQERAMRCEFNMMRDHHK